MKQPTEFNLQTPEGRKAFKEYYERYQAKAKEYDDIVKAYRRTALTYQDGIHEMRVPFGYREGQVIDRVQYKPSADKCKALAEKLGLDYKADLCGPITSHYWQLK